jgi:hypothetical protein
MKIKKNKTRKSICIHNWAAEFVEGYKSIGQDEQRKWVIAGVKYYLEGRKDIAVSFFEKSRLSQKGILYFAIREYVGDEIKEAEFLKWIKNVFKQSSIPVK